MMLWENIVKVGTVSELLLTQDKALARVTIGGRQTPLLPVVMKANSFKRHWVPIRIGEQVTVFSPFGNPDLGFVVPSIFHTGCKEPEGASGHTEVIEYEDGTRIVYDTQAKSLSLNAVGDVFLSARGNITIKADGNFRVEAARVDLN
jgi:phage baseplate assembly protein V